MRFLVSTDPPFKPVRTAVAWRCQCCSYVRHRFLPQADALRGHFVTLTQGLLTLARARQVYPHGSTDALPYCTMGSGSLNAMAVFEDGYAEDLTREQVRARMPPPAWRPLLGLRAAVAGLRRRSPLLSHVVS